MDEEKIIEKRKEKTIEFLKKPVVWVLGFLIIAIILGVYIRSMPMQDHNLNVPGNQPGLWDITTNTWTLGPDLDPWLFTRQAKTIVEKGSLPIIDEMRFVPLGFNNAGETRLLPYMIAWTYYLVNIFGDYNINFAAALFPVLMFVLTIISFFLFAREIFIRKDSESKNKANIISLISTFFMIVIPIFLSRTIAGIPEKESAGFFFMFLAFYLFLKSWKAQTIKNTSIFGTFAGIATASMGLIWGGAVYVFVTIGVATLVAFILNKISKKEAIGYGLWLGVSAIILNLFSSKYTLLGFLNSTSTLISFLVLFIIIIHAILWKTRIKIYGEKYSKKIPKNMLSIIFSILLGGFLVSVLFGMDFIPNKISGLIETFIKPVVGRFNVTVAENRQPYFNEWGASFGPFIQNVPILFWLFFIGSVILFKEMLIKIKNKEAWILTGLYILFFFGLVFSRYAPHPSIFDGEGVLSRIFYFGSAFLLIGTLIYYYFQYHKIGLRSFEEIDYEYLFFFSVFILTLFTARSAVRLIMVLGPIAVIFIGYLIVEMFLKFKKTKDETNKMFIGVFLILITIASIFSFWSFYNEIKIQSYNSIPYYYNNQWQKAMNWTREETPKNAVFAHWWDYGYWLQSIGERATILDGGNPIGLWNYYMGRLVLTGDNQKDALDFLYNHNATHLLIDSSDIGKYGAFSSIGSDKDFDRYSWIGTFLLDEKQTQETKNQTIFVYPGGTGLEEDLIINENGKTILLPAQNAGVGAIIVPVKKNNESLKFEQPYAIFVSSGKQYNQNLRYLSVNKEFVDFGSGLNATVFVFPTIVSEGQGITQNPIGAAMYLSPRLMKGMLVQKYILDDPFNNFPNFKLAHSEPNPIINNLENQGMDLPELVYFQGIQGPIKIWEIKYTGKEEIMPKYVDTNVSNYLSWAL